MGGSITVELTSAEPTQLLQKLLGAGIELWNIGQIVDLTVRVTLKRSHLTLLRQICLSDGASVRILRSAGLFRVLRQISKRPILIFGCLLIGALSLYLPTKVLLIEVEGAGSIPTNQILRNAEGCGIRLGVDRSGLRSERVKNALLGAMPELQWVGINTYGCRAVISVRPRTQIRQEQSPTGISSLIALRDGVIREMTVLKGNAVCKVGQSVTKGQVLISGYTDLGICLQGVHAQGEIFAETRHKVNTITPSQTVLRGRITQQEKKFSLLFGKFRIKFYKGSGISGATCDKMYEYHYITLPGDFRLPIAVVVEENIWRDTDVVTVDKTDAAKLLSSSAEGYLQQQMIAGRIDHRSEIVTALDGVYNQLGEYACYEMIGASHPEEDLSKHENNGTNGERGAG